jgi:hypothetical protein
MPDADMGSPRWMGTDHRVHHRRGLAARMGCRHLPRWARLRAAGASRAGREARLPPRARSRSQPRRGAQHTCPRRDPSHVRRSLRGWVEGAVLDSGPRPVVKISSVSGLVAGSVLADPPPIVFPVSSRTLPDMKRHGLSGLPGLGSPHRAGRNLPLLGLVQVDRELKVHFPHFFPEYRG